MSLLKSLFALALLLLMFAGYMSNHVVHGQKQKEINSVEILDQLMKETHSNLMEASNALTELEVSINALQDNNDPSLKSMIKTKKDQSKEVTQVKDTILQQLKVYETKLGYKAGSESCESIAAQLKTLMKEGQYWIYPNQKPMRVRCKLVGSKWAPLSTKGLASQPDVVVGPLSNSGLFSADGKSIALSLEGKEMLTTHSKGVDIQGAVDASSVKISGQNVFQQIYTFTTTRNFTKGVYFPIIDVNPDKSMMSGTYTCQTAWEARDSGYWLIVHSYVLSWIRFTNAFINDSYIPVPMSTAVHNADKATFNMRYTPRTNKDNKGIAPVLELQINGDYQKDGKNVVFVTKCIQMFDALYTQ